MQPDGEFFTAVRDRVPGCAVVPYRWSGKNSHSARISAGRELAQFTNELCQSNAFRRVWCVAHSHGGNVALYALRDCEFAAKLAGIAFFGTPFLHFRRRNLEQFCHTFTNVLSWLLLFPVYPFVSFLLLFIAMLFGPLVVGFQLFIGNPVGAWLYLRHRKRARLWAERKMLSFLSQRQREADKWLKQSTPLCATYVATISRDEAGIWLACFDRMSEALWAGLAVAGRTIAPVVGIVFSLLIGMVVVDDTLMNFESPFMFLMQMVLGLAAFIVVGPFFAVPVSWIVRGTPLAFGWEGFLKGCTLRIRPSRSPFWESEHTTVREYAADDNIEGQRHCFFYRDMNVIDDVARWICGQRRNPVVWPKSSYAELRKRSNETTLQKASQRRSSDTQPRKRWRWFGRLVIPTIASLIMVVGYVSLLREEVSNASGIKVDTEVNVTSAGRSSVPVFEIDRDFSSAERGFFSISAEPEIIIGAVDVEREARCIIEGKVKLSNWDTSVGITLDGSSEAKRWVENVWSWNSRAGKEVYFNRSFHDGLVLSSASHFELRVWNNGIRPARVVATVYLQCG